MQGIDQGDGFFSGQVLLPKADPDQKQVTFQLEVPNSDYVSESQVRVTGTPAEVTAHHKGKVTVQSRLISS